MSIFTSALEANKMLQEQFGGQEARIPVNSALSDLITDLATHHFQGEPATLNGNRLYFCTFTACPKVVVKPSSLTPILKEESSGSLFHDVVGYRVEVRPLKHPDFGTFTSQKVTLELIEQPGTLTIEDEEAYSQLGVLVNGIDVGPKFGLKSALFTVNFDGHTETQKVEVNEEEELLISLSHLSLSGPIDPETGVVHLPNNRSVNADEYIDNSGVTYLETEYQLNLEFEV